MRLQPVLKKLCLFSSAIVLFACVSNRVEAELPEKVTFDDHIKPIFREHCLSCHNANDKKSGLALDSYAAAMAGGSGGESLSAGDVGSSRLYSLTAQIEQPKMPPNQDKIADEKLALIKKWIEQGMPENSGSAIAKPKVDLAAMGTVTQGRPEGAPPMPESVLKQTPLYTDRPASASALAFSPWSPLLAVGGQEQVVLYHSETGANLGVLPFPEGEPQSITFSRDGRAILVGGGRHSHSGFAVLYEIKTGKRIVRVGDELDIVMAADVNHDNSRIALAGPQKLVRIYDTATGSLLHEMKKHNDWIYALRFSPDGLLVATADRSNGLVVWETDTGRLYLDLLGHKNEIRSLAWRPDSQALLSCALDNTIKMWDMNEGNLIKSWDAHGGGATAIAVSNDGVIVSTGKDNQVKVWDGAGNAAGNMPALADVGMEVAVSVDSKFVAAGDWLGNVRLWERANPANEKRLSPNPPSLQMRLASAQQAIAPIVAKHDAAKKSYDEMASQANAAKQAFTEKDTELNTLVAAVQAKTNEVNTTKNELQADKGKLDAAVSAVAALVASKQVKVGEVAAKKEKNEDVAALLTEVEGISKQVTDQEIIVETNKQSVEKKTALLPTLEAQLKDLTAKQEAVKPVREAAAVALKAADEKAIAAKAAWDATVNEVNAQQAVIATAQADFNQFQAEFQKWNARLAELNGQTEQTKVAQQGEVKAYEAEKTKSDALAAKVDTLKAQLAELQKTMDAQQKEFQAADAVAKAKKAAADEMAAKLGQLVVEQQSIAEQKAAFEKPGIAPQ